MRLLSRALRRFHFRRDNNAVRIAPKQKRIAIDARSIGTSTGTYALNLVRLLEKMANAPESDIRFDVYIQSGNAGAWQPTASNFRVIEVNAPAYTIREQTVFLVRLLSKQYDLVHFCMQQQPILYLRRKITTFHDLTLIMPTALSVDTTMRSEIVRQIIKAAFLVILKTSHVTIAPSNHTKRAIMAFARIRPDRVITTHLAANPRSLQKQRPIDLPFTSFLLYVGNFYAYKNVDTLISAHRLLRSDFPGLGLVLVGRMHKHAIRLQEKHPDASRDNVVFTGFVTDAERDWLYSNAAAYVFPSFNEGFGLPGLEAMAHDLPVVSSDASCLPEIYGRAAEYFDPSRPDEAERAIRRVLSSEDYRAELIAKGQSLVASYSWEKLAHQTSQVYRMATK